MRLPFSREAFFDVFAAYNSALWPAVVAPWQRKRRAIHGANREFPR